jgi:hypothetical protein
MKGHYINWTQDQLNFLKENKLAPRKELTSKFNELFKTDILQGAISSVMKRNSWDTGRTGQFKKGGVPFNKNTVGLLKKNKTSFRKGNRPANYKPVGSERIDKDNNINVKVADPNKWISKHRHVWESKNGKLKKNHLIRFRDGDNRNFDIDNLECVSMRENMLQNLMKVNQAPVEVRKSMKLVCKIQSICLETRI